MSTSNAAPGAKAPVGIRTYRLLREDAASKLGDRSRGLITFQVLTDEAQEELYLRIARNDGGGYVSDEAVAFNSIVRCINQHDAKQPIKADLFRPAFVGRSSNNWGFLAAILVHEGLLQRSKTAPYPMTDAGGWAAWGARHLEITGDLALVKVGREPLAKKPKPTIPEPVDDKQASAPAEDTPDPANTTADEAINSAPHEPSTDAPTAPEVTVRRKGRLTLKKE